MDLNLFKTVNMLTALILATLLIPTIGYAENNIPCPAVNIVQASSPKLDTAQFIKNKYITYTATSTYQSDDLWWFVGVGDIAADSSKEALKMGQLILNKASIQIDVYAAKNGSEYICNYGQGYIQARGKYF